MVGLVWFASVFYLMIWYLAYMNLDTTKFPQFIKANYDGLLVGSWLVIGIILVFLTA